MTPRSQLIFAAAHELEQRELHFPEQIKAGTRDPDEAGRTIAAWRSIVALLRDGAVELEPCLGEDCPRAWLQLVQAVQAAVGHRASRDDPRAAALVEIRSLLLRSAIRAGTNVPSFDRVAA